MLALAVKLPQSIVFSNIHLIGRSWPVRHALAASTWFLVSTPLAKPGRTGNPIRVNGAVDAAAVVTGIKIIMHCGV